MIRIIIALSVVLISFSAHAEDRLNPQYLSDRQIELINTLYPDETHGTMESFSWIRIKDQIIGVPTRFARKGKEYFKKQIELRIQERLDKLAGRRIQMQMLMKLGMTAEEAKLFTEIMESK